MALVACENCGGKISSRARSCPKCGQPTGNLEATAPASPGSPAEPATPIDAPAAALAVPEPAPAEPGQRIGTAEEQPKEARSRVTELRPSNAAGDPSPPPRPAALGVDDSDASQAQLWYFVTSSGRQGPVSLDHLRKLAAAGTIPAQTPIWRGGLPDWVVLSEYRETLQEEHPEEALAPDHGPHPGALVWALALAPLWGSVLQIVATEATVSFTKTKLAYYSEFWWITALANVLVCYLDFYRTRSGEEVDRGETWLCLAVPAYLYRREKAAGGNLMRLWIWVASLVAAVALFLYLNGIYAKIVIK